MKSTPLPWGPIYAGHLQVELTRGVYEVSFPLTSEHVRMRIANGRIHLWEASLTDLFCNNKDLGTKFSPDEFEDESLTAQEQVSFKNRDHLVDISRRGTQGQRVLHKITFGS
jgi:hypothetical protein